MRILEGLPQRAPALEGPSVVAVGVFDGVHLGHQRLLHELLELSSELSGVPTVVTFREHPDRLLHGAAPPLLVSVPHRLRLLRRAGVQRVLLLDFDERVRALSAERFTRTILLDALSMKGLLLGFDSAFGKDREGTPEYMRRLAVELGFRVRVGESLLVDDKPVSSTAIRAAILAGDLEQSRRLLGRWPAALGEVVRGQARGRQLGFPTANVRPDSTVLPPHGVYAVEVMREGEQRFGVANLGLRPTFESTSLATLEVHVLDFDGDLYGETLEVSFVKQLRAERRFASAEALRAQITQDVRHARDFFAVGR